MYESRSHSNEKKSQTTEIFIKDYQEAIKDLKNELSSSRQNAKELKLKLELHNKLHTEQLNQYKSFQRSYRSGVANLLRIQLSQLQEIKNSKAEILELILKLPLVATLNKTILLEATRKQNNKYKIEYDSKTLTERHLQDNADQVEMRREEDTARLSNLIIKIDDYESLLKTQEEQITVLNQELIEKSQEVFELHKRSAVAYAKRTFSKNKDSKKIKQMLDIWEREMEDQFSELEGNINVKGDRVMSLVNRIDLGLNKFLPTKVCRRCLYSLHVKYLSFFSNMRNKICEQISIFEFKIKLMHSGMYSTLKNYKKGLQSQYQASEKKFLQKVDIELFLIIPIG